MNTRTEFLIYKMLTENTGSHMLDSGGAYGRHWERNKQRTIDDFNNDDEVSITLSTYNNKEGKTTGYINRRVSVFHFLSQLQLDNVCDEFNLRNTNAKDWEGGDDEVSGVSKKAWNYLTKQFDEVKVVRSFNTYNGDSDLTQVLQGSWITADSEDEAYLLLQIHNGCDVRGGYTDAKLFVAPEYGNIHEYLMEYEESDYVMEALADGEFGQYIQDDSKPEKVYEIEEVLEILEYQV